jgi:tRNA threonylcarbamoyladenosine biosynthesis protein TsaE
LLTQGIARGLGLKDNEYIRSPSFTLINEYKGKCPIYHIDLYRIESFSEIENLGLEELFSSQGVTLIEWADKLLTPQKSIEFNIDERIEIRIDIVEENIRNYEIQCLGPRNKTHPIFSLQ